MFAKHMLRNHDGMVQTQFYGEFICNCWFQYQQCLSEAFNACKKAVDPPLDISWDDKKNNSISKPDMGLGWSFGP